MPWLLWSETTTEEIAGLDREAIVVVLPVGAVEQHGPHLPLGTDTMICEGLLRRALSRLPEDVTALALPVQAIGHSPEHLGFAGTLSVPAETLLAAWRAIGDDVARSGFRRLLVLNAHGGQPQVAELVTRALRVERGMLAVPVHWADFGLPDGAIPDAEARHGLHGGLVETAMMLALRPDLVRRDRMGDFPSMGLGLARTNRRLGADGPVALAWMAGDLHPSGAVGDAAGAASALGERLLDHAADGLAVLAAEMAAFPLHRLTDVPLPVPGPGGFRAATRSD